MWISLSLNWWVNCSGKTVPYPKASGYRPCIQIYPFVGFNAQRIILSGYKFYEATNAKTKKHGEIQDLLPHFRQRVVSIKNVIFVWLASTVASVFFDVASWSCERQALNPLINKLIGTGATRPRVPLLITSLTWNEIENANNLSANYFFLLKATTLTRLKKTMWRLCSVKLMAWFYPLSSQMTVMLCWKTETLGRNNIHHDRKPLPIIHWPTPWPDTSLAWGHRGLR